MIVPIISSKAGSCLTSQNWLAIGINVVAYELSALLWKPGIGFFNKHTELPDLAAYLGWPKKVVLINDLEGFNHNSKKIQLISPFDGKKLLLEEAQLSDWLQRLNADPVMMEYNITNKPAQDGYDGMLYSNKSTQTLSCQTLSCQTLSCQCEACQLKLTPEYLAFLYSSTPLLARRYYIQHNVSMAKFEYAY